MKFQIKKPDGTFGFLVTRDANSAKKYGTVICEQKEELSDNEMLDQTTGEIVKRPVPEPKPSLEDRINALEDKVALLESREIERV